MRKLKKIVTALSLLVLFVAYQASITAFTHVHYINGVLVSHSHPFHGKHSHTKSEIVVIDRLSNFQSPDMEVHEDVHPMRVLLAVMDVPSVISARLGEVTRTISLRAPPVAV